MADGSKSQTLQHQVKTERQQRAADFWQRTINEGRILRQAAVAEMNASETASHQQRRAPRLVQ